ncbi:MAG TPA: sugar ABC transporter permease [Symbiobacteriaceae bacterium]|nr:sugar ABC transporter permease [Symbiobacteriaceae bacterium]
MANPVLRPARPAAPRGRRDNPRLFGWSVMLPCLIVLLIVGVIPIGYTLYVSFFKFRFLDSAAPTAFVGLANFAAGLQDARFWSSLGRTFVFAGIAIPLEVIIGLGLAILLNRNIRGKGVVRALLILPYMISPIVLAAIWKMMYDPQYGVINGLLMSAGLIREQMTWLSDPKTALGALIFATVWQWYPFSFLLLSAGLETIPAEEYEAAAIDGASGFQSFRYITLPHLLASFTVLLVVRTIDALKTFALIFSLTRGGPGTSTELISYYVYQTTFGDFNVGYGSALGVLLMLVMMVVSLWISRLLNRAILGEA